MPDAEGRSSVLKSILELVWKLPIWEDLELIIAERLDLRNAPWHSPETLSAPFQGQSKN